MKYLSYLFLLLIFLSSCKKEDVCPFEVFVGDFPLSETGVSFNPYTVDNNVAIFKDETGTEFKFAIRDTELQTYDRNVFPGNCPEDASRRVNLTTSSTAFKIKLIGIDLNVEFQLNLINYYHPSWKENSEEEEAVYAEGATLSINAFSSLIKGNGNTEGCLFHRIEQALVNGEPVDRLAQTDVVPTFSILGKTFENVILNNGMGFDPLPIYTVYYTKEKGLIGFVDGNDGKEYVFDRIEN